LRQHGYHGSAESIDPRTYATIALFFRDSSITVASMYILMFQSQVTKNEMPWCKHLVQARPARLERATYGFEVRRSVH
jgi:hypothetical protein